MPAPDAPIWVAPEAPTKSPEPVALQAPCRMVVALACTSIGSDQHVQSTWTLKGPEAE